MIYLDATVTPPQSDDDVPFVMKSLVCDGTESDLQSCQHQGWTTDIQCDVMPVFATCVGKYTGIY